MGLEAQEVVRRQQGGASGQAGSSSALSVLETELREILRATAPRSAARTPPADAAKAGDGLSKEATKVALYCLQFAAQGAPSASAGKAGGSGKPSSGDKAGGSSGSSQGKGKTAAAAAAAAAEAEFHALLSGFQDALLHTVTLLHGSSAAAGPTRRKAIVAAGEGVVDASVHLLRSALAAMAPTLASRKGQKHTGGSSSVASILAGLPQLAGRVEEAVKKAKGVGADDRVAVGRALTLLAASVKDVCREIGEMLPTQSTAGAPASEESKEASREAQPAADREPSTGAARCSKGSPGAERKEEDGKEDEVEEEHEEEEDDEEDLDIDGALNPSEAAVAGGALDLCSSVQALMRELLYTVAKWPTAPWGALPAATLRHAPDAEGSKPASATEPCAAHEHRPESNGGVANPGPHSHEAEVPAVLPDLGEAKAVEVPELRGGELDEAGAPQVPEELQGLDPGVQALELLLASARRVSEHVDEIGASLYPPQEIPNLQAHCQGLHTELRSIRRILAASPSLDALQRVLSAAQACDKNVASCQKVLLEAEPR